MADSSVTNFPNGLSSFGIPLIGSGPFMTTGRAWFVNSVTGLDSYGRGQSPDAPAATLAWAMANLVRSGKGDIVFIASGHTEAISAAAGIACSKADVTIVGLGIGSNRPTFTWGTATTATITITAVGVKFINCVFQGTGFAAVATMFAITAAYAQFYDCRFLVGDATNQAVLGVTLGAGADFAHFERCRFISLTAGGTAAIQGVVAVDSLTVKDCYFNGSWTACIRNTTVAWTNAVIDRNNFVNLASSKSLIVDSATTGVVRDCVSYVAANIAAGGSMTAAGMLKSNNFAQEAAGIASSAVADPATAAIT